MDNLIIYLLKVSAGTSLLYLAYLLLFRKDTFYRRNRIILILTIILPSIFPVLRIPVFTGEQAPAVNVSAFENAFIYDSSVQPVINYSAPGLDYNTIIFYLYFIVAGLLLARIVFSLISTYTIIKKGKIETNKFPRVVISEKGIPPFSFYPYAVIPQGEYKSNNYNNILDHEFAHIRQGHTFDLVLSELCIAFQWFNPFVWLIKRSIILNHEYLADNVSLKNKSAKDYQYMLLNFQTGLKNISLAHSFNSLIKNRIIMINKKPSRKFATLKNILILPVVAFVLYAFATPEYHYAAASEANNSNDKTENPELLQKPVKGIVRDEAGNPLSNVNINTTGTMGNARGYNSGPDGRFELYYVQDDSFISFYLRGYKMKSAKADFSAEMIIKMEKDSDYKAPDYESEWNNPNRPPVPIVVLDGVITKEPAAVINSKLGAELGTIINLTGKAATDKYGDAGKNGVTEIYTKKKAAELGMKIPFRRKGPDDYPTFQGDDFNSFRKWVCFHLSYPPKAIADRIQGRVSVNFTVEADGSISNVSILGKPNPLLSEAALKAVQASPKWEPARNPEARTPYSSMVALNFILPDKIIEDDTYVAVEKMPQYPGGDAALLNFVKVNTKYPADARKELKEGRVIVRFIVNKNGDAEDPIVLKGVYPSIDAEAIRVISRIKGFSPGYQGDTPVNTYYMVPVTFSLAEPEPLFSNESTTEILKFIGANTGYPQDARSASDTGKIYVVVKLDKGGILKEARAYNDNKEITVPVLPEIVIVGYKTSAGAPLSSNSKADELLFMKQERGNTKDHPILKAEGERVASTLGSLNIPEWKDKSVEFAIQMVFYLK